MPIQGPTCPHCGATHFSTQPCAGQPEPSPLKVAVEKIAKIAPARPAPPKKKDERTLGGETVRGIVESLRGTFEQRADDYGRALRRIDAALSAEAAKAAAKVKRWRERKKP